MFDLATVNEALALRLKRELEEVSLIFERQLASDLSAVNALCLHIEHYRGKMLRPTLVLVSGLAAKPEAELTDAHRTLAAVVEMIHMATLVHDDVLDDAEVRRRGATVNQLWGNEAAVILGDYLISNAYHLCSSLGDAELNADLGHVTNTLCEGELVQLRHRHDYGIDEETYLQIIERKTASLIAACCALGARQTGAADQTIESLHRYGLAVGSAFQIQDDLLDLTGEQQVLGKDLGKDLEKGKLTMPLIRLLSLAEPSGRGELLDLIQHRALEPLRQRLLASGAVDYSQAHARRFIDEARGALTTLPDSPARMLLGKMADAAIARVF